MMFIKCLICPTTRVIRLLIGGLYGKDDWIRKLKYDVARVWSNDYQGTDTLEGYLVGPGAWVGDRNRIVACMVNHSVYGMPCILER